jgi:hypothetical protein
MIDPSLKKKLVHEDRWSRTYQVADDEYASESKFEAEGLSISVQELRSSWFSWTESERLNFVNAYRSKPSFGVQDEDVLDFLMENGSEQVWSTIALNLTRHSHKKKVLSFLLDRLQFGSEPKSNFVQALYVLRDAAAIPGLLELQRRLSKEVSPKTVPLDRWKVYEFLKCCEALAFLEGSESHRDTIRTFLDHPDERVRMRARGALAGPQPEEFGDK